MKPITKFLCAALVLTLLGGGADRAQAQFTMNSITRDVEAEIPISLIPTEINARVINAAEARVIRNKEWHARNDVDFQIAFTGKLSQYNKSWTNNNQNAMSGLFNARYFHTYTKNRHTSRFEFEGRYGLINIDKIWFKDNDWFKLYYRAGWSIKTEGFLKNWEYSVSTNFESQFSEGFKSRTEKIIWSNFLAPGTLTPGVGFTYRSPNKKLPFVVEILPISGRIFFVIDDRIDPERRKNLGIPVNWVADPTPDNPENQRPVFKHYKAEGGSNLKVTLGRTFRIGGAKKGFDLNYNTELTSFYGWITQVGRHDDAASQPKILPVTTWRNTFSLKPFKFITVDFTSGMRYDKSQVGKIQMEYLLTIGLAYGYKNR